jgi:Tol biopolymer transport system component
MDADGGTPRQITSGPGNQAVPQWSTDGKWIYFANDLGTTRDIWRMPATGGAPHQVTRTGSGFVAYETADGTSLLYQPVFGDSALLLIPLTGGTGPRRLVECVRSASFAPAGRLVVYVPCDPSSTPPLHAIDPVSGKDHLLGRLENFPPSEFHVNLVASPDGQTIVFAGRRPRGEVMLIENFR